MFSIKSVLMLLSCMLIISESAHSSECGQSTTEFTKAERHQFAGLLLKGIRVHNKPMLVPNENEAIVQSLASLGTMQDVSANQDNDVNVFVRHIKRNLSHDEQTRFYQFCTQLAVHDGSLREQLKKMRKKKNPLLACIIFMCIMD